MSGEEREASVGEEKELVDVLSEYGHGLLILVAVSAIMIPVLGLLSAFFGPGTALYGAGAAYLVLAALITRFFIIESLLNIDFSSITRINPIVLLQAGFISLIVSAASLVAGQLLGNYMVLLVSIASWAIYVIAHAYLSYVFFRVFNSYKYLFITMAYLLLVLPPFIILPPYAYAILIIPLAINYLVVGNTVNVLALGLGVETVHKDYLEKGLPGARGEIIARNITDLELFSKGVSSIGLAVLIDLVTLLILYGVQHIMYLGYASTILYNPIPIMSFLLYSRSILEIGGVSLENILAALLPPMIMIIPLSIRFYLLINGVARYMAPATHSLELRHVIDEKLFNTLKLSSLFNIYASLQLVYLFFIGILALISLGDPELLFTDPGIGLVVRDLIVILSLVFGIIQYIFNTLVFFGIAMVHKEIEEWFREEYFSVSTSFSNLTAFLYISLILIPLTLMLMDIGRIVGGSALTVLFLLLSKTTLLLYRFHVTLIILLAVLATMVSNVIEFGKAIDRLREKMAKLRERL